MIALRTLAASGVFLLAVDCAQVYWTKNGFSQQEFLADRYACERDMRQSGHFGGGLVGAFNMEAFFSRCMESKGYWQARR